MIKFDESCSIVRVQLKELAKISRELMQHEVFKSESDGVRDEGEMRANIMLTYRHIEDATMRLGKAIQAFDGGKSVYSK